MNLGKMIFAMHCSTIRSIFTSDLIRHQRKALKVSGIHFEDTFSEDRYVLFVCLFLMLYFTSLAAFCIILLASSALSDFPLEYHFSLLISSAIVLKYTTFFRPVSSEKNIFS